MGGRSSELLLCIGTIAACTNPMSFSTSIKIDQCMRTKHQIVASPLVSATILTWFAIVVNIICRIIQYSYHLNLLHHSTWSNISFLLSPLVDIHLPLLISNRSC